MYEPQHRSGAHRSEQPELPVRAAKIGRRGLLSAAAIAALSGGAASAASLYRPPAKGRGGRGPRGHQWPGHGPHGPGSGGGQGGGGQTPNQPPPGNPSVPMTPPGALQMRLVGMSAPAAVWAQRAAEVGPGIGARRIFADLSKGPESQIKQVEAAHLAGMLPVVSYKVGGDVAGAVAGQYNAVAAKAGARLASFGLPTAVTFWHEPHTDMSTSDYVAASHQILPAFKTGQLRVGPLLNGFLLDAQVSTFDAYCPDSLMQLWDWVGIDTYQLGSIDAPGKADPAARIYALDRYVRQRGYSHPLGVGEYNGFTPAAIASAGEALLSTPNVWFGCVWNSNGERDYVLSGDRLKAFQKTLQDPRVRTPRTTQ